MPDIDTVVTAVNQYNEENRGKHKKTYDIRNIYGNDVP